MRIGFIGLGAMGLPMAGHLVAAGHDVTVASRSRGPIDAAVSQGAVDGGSPLGVAEASDVIILCVPNSPEVVEVIDGMLPALDTGKTVIDTSTIDPEVERAQHARVGETGARYLDAPLSGGTAGAQKGTLTLMVGGNAETLADMEPALQPFAGLVVHVGGPGMGQVVKLCNQVIYAAQMTATSEATAMAVKSGVDMEKLLLVLTHATGDCVAVRTRLPVPGVIPESPASNGWQPGFMTDLMAKDLDLALAHADRNGVPMATTRTARRLLGEASDAGYGREDFSAVAKVVFAAAGVT
jgi:3-hydroxyisobutyrate dehydrogenase